jgi:hypothetical protein
VSPGRANFKGLLRLRSKSEIRKEVKVSAELFPNFRQSCPF